MSRWVVVLSPDDMRIHYVKQVPEETGLMEAVQLFSEDAGDEDYIVVVEGSFPDDVLAAAVEYVEDCEQRFNGTGD